jgi:hypothetical protein
MSMKTHVPFNCPGGIMQTQLLLPGHGAPCQHEKLGQNWQYATLLSDTAPLAKRQKETNSIILSNFFIFYPYIRP